MKFCGRVLGHGETCSPGFPCGNCVKVYELERENQTLKAQLSAVKDYAEGGFATTPLTVQIEEQRQRAEDEMNAEHQLALAEWAERYLGLEMFSESQSQKLWELSNRIRWADQHRESCEQQLAEARGQLHEIVEIYAGMDGFIPETAGEGYLQRILREMYRAATWPYTDEKPFVEAAAPLPPEKE